MPPRAVSDVWVLLFSDSDELLSAYRKAARVESESGNDDYEVYFARNASELEEAFRHANRLQHVYTLFVVSHASTGMLSYTSSGVDLRVDPGDLPDGKLNPGGIGPWTDVWFYSCRFAGDDLATATPDWKETGRIWSRYFNGARVWGNTGLVNLNSLRGTGRWVHYQTADRIAERR